MTIPLAETSRPDRGTRTDAQMSTTWQFQEHEGYAFVVSTGVATQHTGDTSNLTMLVRDLHHHARETGHTRYLLDRRQVEFGPPPCKLTSPSITRAN